MEKWKDIPNYKGLYQVSDFGRVKNLTSGKILKQSNHSRGYLCVGLRKNSKKKTFLVHQLVVWSFLGFKSNKDYHVDHIDKNTKNNYLKNLRILTNRENTIRTKRGENLLGVRYDVRYDKPNYKAITTIKKHNVFIGRYKTESDAHIAYKIARKNIHLFNGNSKDFRGKLFNIPEFQKLSRFKPKPYLIIWYKKTEKWRVTVQTEDSKKKKHFGYFKTKVDALINLKKEGYFSQ